MKYMLSIILSTIVLIGFAQEVQDENLTGAQIVFTENLFDFGDITQGDRVEHVFEFQNSGNEPLILTDVRTTCGCTAPEWPREPVLPGEKANLKVVFNSTGKIGIQNKIVTVMSNATNNPARVKIISNVLTSKPND